MPNSWNKSDESEIKGKESNDLGLTSRCYCRSRMSTDVRKNICRSSGNRLSQKQSSCPDVWS